MKLCNCCNSKEITTKYHNDYIEYRCTNCGYDFFDYPQEITYSFYSNSFKYKNYYNEYNKLLWHHKLILKNIGYLNNKLVLDFGCHDGFFTKELLKKKIDVYGYDWNIKAIESGKNLYCLNSRISNSYPEKKYDVVIATEIIEHFQNFNFDFDKLSKLVKKKGLLIISTPNKNSIYRSKIDFPPHHFSRFTTRSIKELLISNNFEIIYSKNQFSLILLLRNIVGDFFRKDNIQLKSKTNKTFYTLKFCIDIISIPLDYLFIPINFLLNAIGFNYMGQFIIAKKTHENSL